MASTTRWSGIPSFAASSTKFRTATNSRPFFRGAESMRRKAATKAVYILFLISLCPVLSLAGTPDWLRALSQQPQKKYADDANAVVLLDEQEVTVRDAGDIVTHGRVAYRILRPEGKHVADFTLHFD